MTMTLINFAHLERVEVAERRIPAGNAHYGLMSKGGNTPVGVQSPRTFLLDLAKHLLVMLDASERESKFPLSDSLTCTQCACSSEQVLQLVMLPIPLE